MGRFAKNSVFRTGSHAIGIPVGTSSIGPDAPTAGQARWNTTTSRFEYYTGNATVGSWQAVAHEGFANLVVNTFTVSNVNQLSYGPLSTTYTGGTEKRLLVHVGSVYQIPVVHYTCNGTSNIQFGTGNLASYSGATIAIIEGIGSTSAV
jgi:hypothetical protein